MSHVILTENIWWGFYLASMIILLIGVIYAIRNRFRRNTSAKLLGFLFVVITLIYMPMEISDGKHTWLEGIYAAIVVGIKAIKIDSYSNKLDGVSNALSYCYSLSIVAVRFMLLFISYLTIVSFLGKPYARLQCFLKRKRKTYVFSEVNEKTVTIASDLFSKVTDSSEEMRIIFFCRGKLVNSKNDKSGELYKKVLNNIHAALLENTDINKDFSKFIKPKSYDKTEVFLFGKDDNANISVLDSLKRLAQTKGLRVYVEITGKSWDNVKSLNEGVESNLITNFGWTEENFAYNDLLKTSIFDYAHDAGDEKLLNVLIIGMDGISYQISKCILWLAQMPGFRLKLTVIEDKHYFEKLYFECPSMKPQIDEDGLGILKIINHPGIKYESADFLKIIEENSDFSFAFINTGDNNLNEAIASKLMIEKGRNAGNEKCLIQIRNREHTENFESMFVSDEQIEVTEVGNTKEMYSYENVTNSQIERLAKSVHNKRQVLKCEKNPDYKAVEWNKYCMDEYMRKSTYSRAVSLSHKLKLIERFYGNNREVLKSDDWAKYEHMRWCIYTYCLGFRLSDDIRIKNQKLKLHPHLRRFDELADEIKENDRIDADDSISVFG